MKDALAWHRAHYPLMQPEDVVKLAFQGLMGNGHLLADEETVAKRISTEEEALSPSMALPLTEPLSDRYVRLNLARAMAEGINPVWIARLMCMPVENASQHSRAEVIAFLHSLTAAESGCNTAALTTATASVGNACWFPSHSAAYRAAYHPAYRVLHQEAAALLPLLAAIHKECEQKPRILIAIDGPCAGGKTTLAAHLSYVLGNAPVVHMDDFYTPHGQKTLERLAQPGGNADVERFCAEVLTPLLRSGHTAYRPYSCAQDCLLAPIDVPTAPVTIIEGAYCLHPGTGRPYDVQAFLPVDAQTQQTRILRRNGEAGWENFRTRWIPLEKAYFSAFQLPDDRCLVLSQNGQQFSCPA